MTILNKHTTTSEDKNELYIKADEPTAKVLKDKLEYHRSQSKFHLQQATELEKILEFMEITVPAYPSGTIGTFKKEQTVEIGLDSLKKKTFWVNTSISSIRAAGILLQTSDIFNSVKQNVNDSERRNIIAIISTVLGELCESEQLKKYRVEGKKGYYYGTPEMFNGDKPIVEY